MKMKSLIIGSGEVGTSLYNILKPYYDVTIIDKEKLKIKGIEILHICFPFSKNFIKEVKEYQKEYKPKYAIIHSTVEIGTCRKLNAIHSPVIGIHPFLENSLKTFIKFLGGEKAGKVADYFRRAGVKVYICKESETTELAKISQTTQYALMVEYVKNLKKECDKYKVPFSEVYTLFSQNYNEGYQKLGYSEYKLPLLIPIMNKIGGHCLLKNCNLWDTPFTKIIKKLNK